tara:strand:- start:65 stop:655 length:591 start_codon:yes stop_codon:yes gene_type:complete
MAFKVNGLDVINDSKEVANMIATTAEAQAGTINNKVMTPQRTKELIQGGTVSMIKSFQRIDFRLGSFNFGTNIQYITMGAAPGLIPFQGGSDPSGVVFRTTGDAATFCFFNSFGTKNRYKTMILVNHGGSSAKVGGNFLRQGNSNNPAFENFSALARFNGASNTEIQVAHTDYIMWESATLTLPGPQVWLQMIEFY